MFAVSAKGWVLSVYHCIVPVRGEHKLPWEKNFPLCNLFLLTLSSLSEIMYRITKWLRLAETCGDQPLQLKAGSDRVGSLGMCPVGFWVSSRLKSPQPLWPTRYYSGHHQQQQGFPFNFLYFNLCPLTLSFHGILLSVVWLDLHYTFLAGICMHW